MEIAMKGALSLAFALLFTIAPAKGAVRYFDGYSFEAQVLVDGGRNYENWQRGGNHLYVQEGQQYSLEVRNPLPVRVGVAVTIDALNVIDGARAEPAAGQKWLIEPYGTLSIRGWQTSQAGLRRFVFTRPEHSYSTWKGERDDRDYSRDMGRIRIAYFWDSAELAAALNPYPPYAIQQGRASGLEYSEESRALRRRYDDRAGTGMGGSEKNPVRQMAFNFNAGMYRESDALTIEYSFAPPPPCWRRGWCAEPPWPRSGTFAPEMP
jgi:hypothetical protein